MLLYAQKTMNARGSMKLTGVCREVMDVLKVTGVANVLTVE